MSTWREESRINRPLLYLTGGLVLGETMALFVTAEQGFFWLAAMLLVFSCVFVFEKKQGAGEEKRGRPASFCISAVGRVPMEGHAPVARRVPMEGRLPAAGRVLMAERFSAAGCLSMTGRVPVMGIAAVLLGCSLGFGRMECEERRFLREEEAVEAWGDEKVQVSGVAAELSESSYGIRVVLKDCKGASGHLVPRRMYCYLDGDAGKELKLGMRILVTGEGKAPEPDRNPGGFDYRLYCRARGIGGILYGDRMELLDSSYWPAAEGLRRARLAFSAQLDRIVAEPDRGILKAVLLGMKSDMEDEVYELYRKNGISHLLAISGLHVSIIGMGLWKGLRKCGLGYAGAGAVSWGVLFCYGAMTGFGPSVVRAVFMAGISFLAAELGRTYDLPSAMCVPAIGLLSFKPYLLTQASFQLSFLAVGAVFFPGGYLAKRFGAKGIWQAVLVSASIQAVTAPVILFHSFEFPIYGVVLNLLVIPFMTYVMVSGIMGLAVSFVSEAGGAALLGGAHYILGFYELAGEFVQKLPGASLVLGRPGFLPAALFYGGILAGIRVASKKGRKGAWAFMWALSFCLLFPMPRPGLSVTFLDVGQGDGILLRARGKTMLVDCGSSQEKNLGEDCLVPYLKSQGIARLDTVAVSHGDSDHISGIQYLLDTPECGISIGTLMMPEAGRYVEVYEKMRLKAEKQGISVVYGKRGDELFGVLGGKVSVSCLHPEEGVSYADRNEESLVFLVRYGRFSLLLTGDMEAGAEEEMLAEGGLFSVTVLKAAHHGSDTSSTEEFLKAVRPKFAVISYGRGNRYGHPSPEVLERLEGLGTECYETGRLGAVEVWTDGERMKISGWLDRPGGI